MQQLQEDSRLKFNNDVANIKEQMEKLMTLIRLIFVLLFLICLLMCYSNGLHRVLMRSFLDILDLEQKKAFQDTTVIPPLHQDKITVKPVTDTCT